MKLKTADSSLKARLLYQLIAMRLVIEDSERELKAWFKDRMSDDDRMIDVGDFLVTARSMERLYIDRNKLVAGIGVEASKKYTNLTEYEVMDVVKKTKKGRIKR